MKQILVLLLVVIMMSACNEGADMKQNYAAPESLKISRHSIYNLDNSKIYFGHQSVGDNIINGIKSLMVNNPEFKINIKEIKPGENISNATFAHNSIGGNGLPGSKIEAFKNNMEDGIGNNVDIAFMKLCFWDIRRGTDVDEVFKYYERTMGELEKEYPNTKFVHFSVPLMTRDTSTKSKIKRMIGIDVKTDLDNIKRNELNRLLEQKYKNSGAYFDIAELESTKENGDRYYFEKGGKRYYYLGDEYTKDGGHLNERGQIYIAGKLIEFLASKMPEPDKK